MNAVRPDIVPCGLHPRSPRSGRPQATGADRLPRSAPAGRRCLRVRANFPVGAAGADEGAAIRAFVAGSADTEAAAALHPAIALLAAAVAALVRGPAPITLAMAAVPLAPQHAASTGVLGLGSASDPANRHSKGTANQAPNQRPAIGAARRHRLRHHVEPCSIHVIASFTRSPAIDLQRRSTSAYAPKMRVA